jgi:hypothetical protein
MRSRCLLERSDKERVGMRAWGETGMPRKFLEEQILRKRLRTWP